MAILGHLQFDLPLPTQANTIQVCTDETAILYTVLEVAPVDRFLALATSPSIRPSRAQCIEWCHSSRMKSISLLGICPITQFQLIALPEMYVDWYAVCPLLQVKRPVSDQLIDALVSQSIALPRLLVQCVWRYSQGASTVSCMRRTSLLQEGGWQRRVHRTHETLLR